MSRISQFLAFALVVLFSTAPWNSASAEQPRHKSKRPVKQVQPAPVQEAPVQPSGPLTPLTLQQTPALPAQVDYRNGQLTIMARNSTMGDILRAVKTQTGATMDYPPNATERVMGQFGPGPARDVLAALLSGSNFNFAIVGSVTNPSIVDKVIITRNSGPVTAASQPPAGTLRPGFPPPNQGDIQSGDDQADSDDASSAEEGNEQPDQAGPQLSEDQQRQQQQAIKTPEQLLQELQRQQQMQQQQMQQQQGGVPQSFPQQPPDQSDTPLRRNRE